VKLLSKLDSRKIAIIVIGLALLIAGLWYYLWLKPAKQRIQTIDQEIKQLELQRQRGLMARRRLPQLRTQIAELEREIQSFLAALPEEEKFYEVLDLLAKNAKETGVVLNALSRSPARSQIADVGSVDVELRVEAPFPELYAYLKRLEELKRYSSIHGITFNTIEQTAVNPRIGANLTIRFYIYRGPRNEGEAQ